MTLQLKQFVPSHVCLKCEGCCRFQLSDSPWRPKVGAYEITEEVDASGHIKTVLEQGHHRCVFFNFTDHTCGVYQNRPLECALYPYILSKNAQGLKLFVHLACPYVQEHEDRDAMKEYEAYLKTFFKEQNTKEFLRRNSGLLHDYSEFEGELKLVFDIHL